MAEKNAAVLGATLEDSSSENLDQVRLEKDAAFAAGGGNQFYRPIPEYEGAHRFDPKIEWEEKEEKRLIRRLDFRICLPICIGFLALQLDRANISQALSDNMLTDLGLTTNDYNYGMTIFYVSFLSAELPSNMISKKLGPDVWIPIQMVAWSIVACSQELPLRLAYFWGAYIITNIISALLAYGILHMRGISGWAGWRWLFVLEGALTAIIGIAAGFYLPPSPTQTKGRFRGKNGWFNEREEKIMVNRILRDDPAKGGMHNRQGLTPKLLWLSLLDWDLWPIYLLGLTWQIPPQPVTAYLTLNLKALGFNTFQTNLMTIPAYVLFLIQLVFWTWLSERVNDRMTTVLVSQLWMLPIILALELLSTSASPWIWYTLSILLIGYPYVHAILVALTSRNAGSVRTRTVGSALYNMFVQAGNVVSSNIYNAPDAPYYRIGNKVLLGIVAYNIALIVAIKFFYIWRNSQRDKRWNALTTEEKDHYLATTKDTGSKRLDFRFAH